MMTKFATKLGLAFVAIGLSAAPALAADAPAKHNAAAHKTIAAKKGTPAHDSMADQLNAASLSAAQNGTVFTPPGAAPNATPMPASTVKKKM